MKSLTQYIQEANIGGLKNVKFIRHYTTGDGILNILKDGLIKANESTGDIDWKKYDLTNDKVVSFHDIRTDPEWNMMIKSNNEERDLLGTHTLAIHRDKICACIEFDYEKLDNSIIDKASIINKYGVMADRFCNYWNALVNGIKTGKITKPNKMSIVYAIHSGYEDEALMFFKRKNLHIITDKERKEFIDNVTFWNISWIINFMKNHGWQPEDTKRGVWQFAHEYYTDQDFVVDDNDNEIKTDVTIGRWLDEIVKSNSDILDKNVEIRISSDIEIDKNNCTIKIFDGICKGSKQLKVIKAVDKYKNLYNIQHVLPE